MGAMVWALSITRRGAPVAGAAAARGPCSTADRLRQLTRRNNSDATARISQRPELAIKTMPIPSAGTTAPPPTAPSDALPPPGAAVHDKGSSGGGGGGGGGGVDEELWFVGRLMEGMDTRLGAKQEKLRVREIGVIERFAAVISALDCSLEPREGDGFLAWLRSRGFDADYSSSPPPSPSQPSQEDDGSPAVVGVGEDERTAAARVSSTGGAKIEEHGTSGESGGEGEVADGARKRAEVEAFLSSAAARLNALVAGNEETLFQDRGEREPAQGTEEGAGENGAAASRGNATGDAAVSPNMSDEDLYQAKLGAHRAMLCHCLSLLSSSLSKQQLKTGLSVDEVAAAARAAYLAAPEDRLAAVYPLFDIHGDGYLDAESVERAVDAVVLPVTAAAERCYSAAARSTLDKKAAAAMPPTMKYVLWDVLEVPVKRRCSFAWAEDCKQVGPDEWRASWEQFAPSRRKHFPELDSVAGNYVAEFSRRRSAWHTSRKGRKKAMVYGTALLVGVVFIDNLLKIV